MKKRPASFLRYPIFLALLFSLFSLSIFTSSCEESQSKRSEPKAPSTEYGTWPGDPIPGLVDPDSHPVRKVNIKGIVKNAFRVSRSKPVFFNADPAAYRLRFSAGVVPGTTDKPVEFTVKEGSVVLGRLEVDPDSPKGWQALEVRISEDRGITLEFHCSLPGPGAYIANPRAKASFHLGPVPLNRIAFILVDALRADALGIYGAEGDPSPVIDGVAKKGVVFTRAYTSSPFTLTSLASIFTGLHPWQHKVLFSSEGGLYLDDSVPSLVQQFREAGYHTAAFSGTYFFLSRNGLARGFDHMDETCAGSFFRDSAECLNDRIEGWLPGHYNEPVFLYVHYVDPHAPYYAPEPYRSRYLSGLDKPRHSDVILGEIEQFSENRPWYQFYRKPSVTDLAYLRGLYQGEVSYVDAKLGEIFDALDSQQFSLLLITADHGEAFYEHGAMDHVADIHEPVMRVPFILKEYEGGSSLLHGVPEGKRIDAQVRTIDMLPTLLHLAGIMPPDDIPGRSLAPLLDGETLPPEPAAALHHVKYKPEYGMVLWPWKFFFKPHNSDMKLYRLDQDPAEENDVSKSQPEELKTMKSLLDHLMSLKSPASGVPAPPIDEDTKQRMKALGYLK